MRSQSKDYFYVCIVLEFMVKFIAFSPGFPGKVPGIQFTNGSLTYLGEKEKGADVEQILNI